MPADNIILFEVLGVRASLPRLIRLSMQLQAMNENEVLGRAAGECCYDT